MLFKGKMYWKFSLKTINSVKWYFCFLWKAHLPMYILYKGVCRLGLFLYSRWNGAPQGVGVAHWAEGACRQWLRSVIRSCSPNPCWLESAGHRPFSLGKQAMNHCNWHKLSGMLLNVFYSLLIEGIRKGGFFEFESTLEAKYTFVQADVFPG